jgi:hypothetical protein
MEGNQEQYPAALPHVVSVAALAPDLTSAVFSNANMAVDVAAPGVGVPVAIPAVFDVTDGVQDGVTLADGTSFAAPMVAGAAAWVRSQRPRLDGSQVADVLRLSAQDVGRRGYDTDTGFGLVQVPRALDFAAPRRDPLEPNDDIPYVDGTFFRRGDPYLYKGRNSSIGANVDLAEDPFDVYRFRMPGHSSLVATTRPRYGDPDLIAYHDGAKRLSRTGAIVDASFNSRGADRVRLVNRGPRFVYGYLVVTVNPDARFVDSRYSLRVTRTG